MDKVKRKKKKRRNSVKDLPTNREQMYTGRRLSLTERLRDINKRRPSPVKIKQENKQRRRNGDLLSKSFEKRINDTFDLSEEEADAHAAQESE